MFFARVPRVLAIKNTKTYTPVAKNEVIASATLNEVSANATVANEKTAFI